MGIGNIQIVLKLGSVKYPRSRLLNSPTCNVFNCSPHNFAYNHDPIVDQINHVVESIQLFVPDLCVLDLIEMLPWW